MSCDCSGAIERSRDAIAALAQFPLELLLFDAVFSARHIRIVEQYALFRAVLGMAPGDPPSKGNRALITARDAMVRSDGLPKVLVRRIAAGESVSLRVAALASFVSEIMRTGTSPGPKARRRFRQAGFSDGAVGEVVKAVSIALIRQTLNGPGRAGLPDAECLEMVLACTSLDPG